MPEWLVEHGIGEQRALLVDVETVLAAKCRWPGELHAGQAIEAKLVHKTGARGLGEMVSGQQLWLDKLPSSASEGATLPFTITRAALAERGRLKLAAARPPEAVRDMPRDVFAEARTVRRLPAGAWEDIWSEAWSGEIAFGGGSALFSVTSAMCLADIDGDLPAKSLALRAVEAVAQALPRYDLGGSIGIDFPTLQAKADRKRVDDALDDALADWPHERTAMNGFGFVQLVARLEGPSLLHRMATSRVGAAARMALRRAEMVEGAGTTLLTIHPALKAKLKPEWLSELERRTARPVRLETDAGLALEAATAQIVAHDN